MNLDLGYGVIQMIKISIKKLEAMLKTYKDQAKYKTQEIEAWTQIHKQSWSHSSRDKEVNELELSHDLGSTQIDMKLDQSCRAFH